MFGFGRSKIGHGVDRRDRNVLRLSDRLIVDRNEKIIGDIGRIALERGKGSGNKRG